MPEENPMLQRQRTIEWLTASRQPSSVPQEAAGATTGGGRRASMDQQQLSSQAVGPWGALHQRRRPSSFFGARCALSPTDYITDLTRGCQL